MGAQERLAAYFRQLAQQADDGLHSRAWAEYIDGLPAENEHLRAIARSQAEIGDPAEFTPVCDDGVHLRALAAQAPWPDGIEYIASLEGTPEPWVYGDWAKQGPAPERDGVPHWTVEVDVMVHGDDWDWPPEFEHPDAEPVTRYGWGEVWPTYENHHLEAELELWAPDEEAALALAQRLVGAHWRRPAVLAHRLRAQRTPGAWEDKPRRPEDLVGGVSTMPWQRVDVDADSLTIVWRSHGETFDHVSVDERPDRVTVTVHARFAPIWTEEGDPIVHAGPDVFRVASTRVQLERPLGERPVLDGATGRRPDELSIWQYRELEEREQILRARLPG